MQSLCCRCVGREQTYACLPTRPTLLSSGSLESVATVTRQLPANTMQIQRSVPHRYIQILGDLEVSKTSERTRRRKRGEKKEKTTGRGRRGEKKEMMRWSGEGLDRRVGPLSATPMCASALAPTGQPRLTVVQLIAQTDGTLVVH